MEDQEMMLQLGSGYMFNSDKDRLEKYEFISCRFNFATDTVIYNCMLGGKESTISDNKLTIYSSEDNFKKGVKVGPTHIKFNSAMRRSYGFLPQWENGVPYAWSFEDGDAVKVNISNITFTAIKNNRIEKDDYHEIYETRERVFDFHDFTVKEADGTIRVVKSTASKLMLNDEQSFLIGKLQSVLKELAATNTKLVFDQAEGRLCAIPMHDVLELTPYLDKDLKDFTDITDIITRIESDVIMGFYSDSEGVSAKLKE